MSATKITYDGVTYPSINACARANGVSPTRLHDRLSRGMSIERAMSAEKLTAPNPSAGKRITYGNVTYPSIAACAKALDVSYPVLSKHLRDGMTVDDAIVRMRTYSPGTKTTADGTTYESRTACAKAHGLSRECLEHRLKTGETLNAALKRPKAPARKPVIVDDVTYPSIRACAHALNISEENARKLRDGVVTLRDVKPLKPKRPQPGPIVHQGRTYDSTRKLADAHGVHPKTVAARLRAGKSVEESVAPTNRRPQRSGPVTAFGITYPNATAFANAHGLTPAVAQRKLAKGVDPETIISNRTTRPMTTRTGARIYVPFDKAPKFAFTNATGEHHYYAQCPTCHRILVLHENDLTTFRHDEKMCNQNELPPTAKINDRTVQLWLELKEESTEP